MNKKYLFVMPLLGALALAGCGKKEEAHQHVDANHDHKCDACGEVMSNHTDENGDFKCDYCGADLSTASVALDTSDVVTSFGTDEVFSSFGLKVVATSEIGSKMELEFETSEPDLSEPGQKTVTVTYQLGGEARTLEYTINVSTWSAGDLEKLLAVGEAELTYLADSGIPFLPDHDMRVELVTEDEEVTDFYITADNMDNESYLRFIEDLKEYSYYDEEEEISYSFIESDNVTLPTNLGITDAVVFRLTPSEEGQYQEERVYVSDEYLLLGFDANGNFVIDTTIVNAMIDGAALGTDVNTFNDESLWGYSKYGDELIEIVSDLPYYYYSEYSSKKVVKPELKATSSFYPISYFSTYPFSSLNDDYDLAFQIRSGNNTEDIHTAFVQALLDAGYILQPAEEEGDAPVYVFEGEKEGRLEYTVYPFQNGYIVFDFFYNAPEVYTSHLRDAVTELATLSGITLAEKDPIHSGNHSSIGLYAYAQGTDSLESYSSENHSLEVSIAIARNILEGGEGYVVKKEAELKTSSVDGSKYYEIVLSNGTVELSVDVDQVADKDGKFAVELFVQNDKYAISPAELLAAKLCDTLNGHFGLKGVDYAEDSTNKTFNIAKDVESASLQEAAEGYAAAITAEGFTQASSEGDAESWVVVYDNMNADLRVTVTAVPGSEEGHVSVTIASEVHRFTTPEVIAKQYIENATGAPATPESYTTDPTTFACVVEGSLTGEFDTPDKIIAAAGEIAAKLPEGFVADGARSLGTGVYRFAYRNAEIGIEAILVITLKEGGADTVLTFEFMPEYSIEESVMKKTLSTLLGYEALSGVEYSYDGESDVYYGLKIFVLSGTTADDVDTVGASMSSSLSSVFTDTEAGIKFLELGTDDSQYGEGKLFIFGVTDSATFGVYVLIDVYYHTTAQCLVYRVQAYSL